MDARLTMPPLSSAALPPQALWVEPRAKLETDGVRDHSAKDSASLESPRHATKAAEAAKRRAEKVARKRVGELSGTVFYTTLVKEMQKSTFRTPLMHGGRAEEAFQGQLALELGKSIGRSANDPVAAHLFRAIQKREGRRLTSGHTTEVRA